MITIHSVGDSALLVEFENRISPDIHDQVLGMARALENAGIPGVREIVTGYRNLVVHYDPILIDFSSIRDAIHSIPSGPDNAGTTGNHWQIPVLYGGDAGRDLHRISEHNGLSEDEIVRLHSSAVYRVYMIGFAPGWTFLGGLDQRLMTPRLETPRAEVPAGCVSIGGQQTLIGGLAMPSGWNLIGQTPEKMFAPQRSTAFFVNPGDLISFRVIDQAEFEALVRQSEQDAPVSVELKHASP